ncbi:MAG TPA: hypothetical protein VIO61_09860 [Anaerolineaceae bacterium]
MKSAFVTIWKSLVFVYDDILTVILFNILWFFVSLGILTAPPAMAGLYYATNQIAHRESVDWKTLFYGFKKYFWASWRWSILNLLVIGVLISNIIFYRNLNQSWGFLVQSLFLGLSVIWLSIQMFMYPLLIEQEKPDVRTALRNCLILYSKKPWLTIFSLLFIIILIVISYYFTVAFVVLTVGFIAYFENYLTIYLIQEIKLSSPPPAGMADDQTSKPL